MAAGILLLIVVAVTGAVTAGQHLGFEAQQRISGTLAAEELMGRLTQVGYGDLQKWDGYEEKPGEMLDPNGEPMPAGFRRIGRIVFVTDTVMLTPATDLNILGRMVRVQSFDAHENVLTDIRRFVPYPSKSLPDADDDDDVLFADAGETEEDGGGGGGIVSTTTSTVTNTTTTILGGGTK